MRVPVGKHYRPSNLAAHTKRSSDQGARPSSIHQPRISSGSVLIIRENNRLARGVHFAAKPFTCIKNFIQQRMIVAGDCLKSALFVIHM
ncbi:hypothetical protein D3C75_787080 [compost metagenome]